MNGGPLRLFVALPLSEEARAAAAAAAAACHRLGPHLKWVDPSLYHLTLRFLGETPADRLDELRDGFAAAAAETSPFALRLGAFSTLPRGPGARVLALALVEGGAPLAALAAACEETSRRLGFPPEGRPFRAHLTLARSRQGESLPAAFGAPVPVAHQPAWRAEALLLVESLLGPRGPRYRVRATLPFGGPRAAA